MPDTRKSGGDDTDTDTPSPIDPFQGMADLAAQGQAMMAEWMSGFAASMPTPPPTPPKAEGNAAAREFTAAMADAKFDTSALMGAQTELWSGYQRLWLATTQRMLNAGASPAEPVIEPEAGDRRFRDADWSENPYFDFLKQSYLLNSRWMKNILSATEGLDPDTEQKLDFYARQMIDALAPSNFPLTNPEVVREIQASKGENLVRGARNFQADVKRGDGSPVITQTDMDAFEVGKDLAVSPGAVVFQNELFQLIQYAPQSDKAFKRPLLIIPPWINKFYILDLQPENSFIKWLSEQGYTVFLMSWVNPDASLRDKGFDDYMSDGILAAMDAIEQATGEKDLTAIGYCIGGTLLSATLAYMAAHNDHRVKAATFLAAQVDFSEAGELRVFADDAQIKKIEEEVKKHGYLDGKQMAWTFNMLRANDLIWSFVVNNYLLGKDPGAFDLLFWNADSTRFAGRLLIDYLRNMYQKNLLVEPGGIELLDTPIDLGLIKTPAFFQATREDHIAPYKSVYKAVSLFAGEKRFALAGSGHIAGIVNPPAKQKYQYWTNAKRKKYADGDAWLADATEHPGSWWPYWHEWNAKKSGAKVAARQPGDGALKIIEAAPGSYVKVKS
jgi:polyhydroxyalkanoate synthase